jgi:hypothetical protein
MRRTAFVAILGAMALSSCTPEWAKQGDSPAILLMTGINDGQVLTSDVAISTGSVCPDTVALRVENHFKNPNQPTTGFRHDIVIDRYTVRYFRSDGRNVEGVDVPFAISGAVAQEVQEEGSATLNLEIVRRQAKLEPPLRNLTTGGGALIVTTFAEVTVYAHDLTGHRTNSASATVQIDFADFADTQDSCGT